MRDDESQSILALATALARVHEHNAAAAPLTLLCDLLDTVEQRVRQHQHAFGVASVRFQLGCEEFVLLSNTVAMQALQQQPPDHTLCAELLTRAEQHTRRTGILQSLLAPSSSEQSNNAHASRRVELRLLCLNNLACLHKATARPLIALSWLEKVLKIQVKQVTVLRVLSDTDATLVTHATALTHLNLCAVLSQLERHSAAAEHARASIALLAVLEREYAGDAQLALVAHYNWGVELEHSGDRKHALRVYTAALHLAQQHDITSELVRSIEEIVREQQQQQQQQAQQAQLDRRTATKRAAALSQYRAISSRSFCLS